MREKKIVFVWFFHSLGVVIFLVLLGRLCMTNSIFGNFSLFSHAMLGCCPFGCLCVWVVCCRFFSLIFLVDGCFSIVGQRQIESKEFFFFVSFVLLCREQRIIS